MHEIKFDGYRIQLHRGGGRSTRALTRNGFDWTDRFPAIVATAHALPGREFIIDGEAVVLDAHGKPDMAQLRSSLSAGRGERFVGFAFDLLFLDGRDLRPAPLLKR